MSSGAEPPAAVVLAGGAGTRAGGRDKGLLAWRGEPLVAHALRRLREAGIDEIVVSANRNAAEYARHGCPVLADAEPGEFRGPLAGISRALGAVASTRLLTVPVDVPDWPVALVPALQDALVRGAAACSVARVAGRREPLFALYPTAVAREADAALARGERAVHAFQDRIGCVEVDIAAGPGAFANLNDAEAFA
ncbi:MAG TPA: molybdenum cofactor guanylyltransferase MobA [Xanthomonadales bacterium]|nr:molybdenum cofactor guanylyltransferase MobA [Xanthomonadales bacterium]